MKTSDLTGPALNWAVGVAQGKQWKNDPDLGMHHTEHPHPDQRANMLLFPIGWWKMDDWSCEVYSPSSDWSQGGPIIEREVIELNIHDHMTMEWIATRREGSSVSEERGPTPLVAAMRCFVASKLGDEVDIPEELI
jgi:hypothetical protein